ncbi:O-antigen ligase [Pleomorphomonas sp. JP5]|uniref:O-antigen ligase family protein n=1 Tax=Pleomorphomonas sp. JP5 TaxID=2942998 RepID=UPI00204378A2|nr:O-antigen ligase family protein [Pleomorphomonas sp. JP5]MCM5559829.1 O-antigen ligase family protein [Pleomorphomonas sp. JP5]
MSRRSKGHDYLGWALVVTALLAPMPWGGIRAFFFMLYAVVVAVLGLSYAIGLYRGHVRPRLPLSAFAVPVILFSLVIVWMLVTLLPLGLAAAPEWAALSPLADLTGRISIGPGATFDMLVRYLTYGLFFVLALQVAVEKKRAKTLFRVIYLGIAAHALIALASLSFFGDVLLFLPKEAYIGDATGTFVNRNSFATFAAFGAIMGVALIFGVDEDDVSRSQLSRILTQLGFNVAPLALIGLALAFSHSRMGMFVAALGAGFVALIAVFRATGARRILAGMLIVAGLVTGAVLANTSGILFERMASVDRDADVRLAVYEQTLDLIAARPMSGYGGGTYEDAFRAVKSDPISPDVTFDAAHNLYLELAAELGIPAMIAVVLSVLLLAGTTAIAAMRRENWTIPAAAAAVVLAGSVHSLVDFSLQIPAIVLMMLLILALGFAQSRPIQQVE